MKTKNETAEIDIGTLSHLTGINTSTIRTWENRYEVFTPAKSETGRRLYRQEDVNRLVLIKQLLDRGHKISSLGNRNTDELTALLQHTPPHQQEDRKGSLFSGLVDAIDHDDVEKFRRWLAFSVAELTPLLAVRELFLPILRLIGERWHQGQLDIAQEHMLSEVIRNQLLTSISGFKAAEEGPRIAFSTLAGEPHEFGALMACYLASSRRLRTVYFGANLPAADLVTASLRMKVDLIVVSSILFTQHSEKEVRALSHMLNGRIPVWLGCQTDPSSSKLNDMPDVKIVPDLTLFETYLNAFLLSAQGPR